MPTVNRVFLKLALLYFVAALACAVAMAWLGGAWGARLLPTYLHLFTVGWITQMIIGVALWLFPKWTREHPRGYEWLSWLALITINAGLLLRAGAEPAQVVIGADSAWQPTLSVALVASAALQWAGGMAFLANVWGRIKVKKKKRRRKKSREADDEEESEGDADGEEE